MSSNGSGYYVDYDFEYDNNGVENHYSYNIPFDVFCQGIREYFTAMNVKIDGTDKAIWNVVQNLGSNYDYSSCISFDVIFDAEEDWFKEKCKDAAYAEWKEEYESENLLD